MSIVPPRGRRHDRPHRCHDSVVHRDDFPAVSRPDRKQTSADARVRDQADSVTSPIMIVVVVPSRMSEMLTAPTPVLSLPWSQTPLCDAGLLEPSAQLVMFPTVCSREGRIHVRRLQVLMSSVGGADRKRLFHVVEGVQGDAEDDHPWVPSFRVVRHASITPTGRTLGERADESGIGFVSGTAIAYDRERIGRMPILTRRPASHAGPASLRSLWSRSSGARSRRETHRCPRKVRSSGHERSARAGGWCAKRRLPASGLPGDSGGRGRAGG